MDFNILGMIDVQGISDFSKEMPLLSTFQIYSNFISVIEKNASVKKYEEQVSKHLLGDAVYFYFLC